MNPDNVRVKDLRPRVIKLQDRNYIAHQNPTVVVRQVACHQVTVTVLFLGYTNPVSPLCVCFGGGGLQLIPHARFLHFVCGYNPHDA